MSGSCDRDNCPAKPGGNIDRRVVVQAFLTAIAAGVPGGASAAGAPIGYLPMKEPLRIPAALVDVPWKPVEFKACFIRPDGRDGYVPGMALRTSGAGDFGVFCRHCPHMLCLCNLSDEHQILCQCHQSIFDPAAGGKRISGPAQRALYKFAFDVTGEGLRISGIEASIEERLP